METLIFILNHLDCNEKKQVCYLSYTPEYIADMVPGDSKFPESLEQTFTKIRAMIDKAK